MKALLLLFLALTSISCKNWIVLVAGSNTFGNYRHQAEVYHLYQLIKRYNIPDQRIITFAFDDIASNTRNPLPGEVYNVPNATNVYEGIKIDYIARDVTPENFVGAITGNKTKLKLHDERSTGKVLESTKDDNVFIYFTGHGGDGMIEFPSGFLDCETHFLALEEMYNKTMFKEMVYYMDSDDSLNMFQQYNDQLIQYRIYVVAADTDQKYCGKEAVAKGVQIGTCLGNYFSNGFIEDVDKKGEDLKYVTLQEQYDYLAWLIEGIMLQFGDPSVADKSLYEFFRSDAADNEYNPEGKKGNLRWAK